MSRPLGFVLAQICVGAEDVALHDVLFKLAHECLGVAETEINAESSEWMYSMASVSNKNDSLCDVTFWKT